MVSNLAESLPSTFSGKYLSGQIVRSGIAPALNYGEAKSAESPNDFIHKMKIACKELRETFIALNIIKKKEFEKTRNVIDPCISECNELISIFVKSIQTAERNQGRRL
jgi:four helix bundle protein